MCFLFFHFFFFLYLLFFFFFFFFQAEDGIRDGTVTGVQTCALPIFSRTRAPPHRACVAPVLFEAQVQRTPDAVALVFERRRTKDEGPRTKDEQDRSEERRVGKECRTRWTTED